MAAILGAGALVLSGCSAAGEDDSTQPSATQATSESPASDDAMSGHEHAMDGGQPPKGITKEADPKFAVGAEVVLTADHMPGMDGADATIAGAFDTATYSVSYTPTDGGEPVEDHKWVVQEELENPGEAPLKDGTEVTLEADHMPGMKGAKATIEGSTDETVYMVDVKTEDMTMKNHKWVVESEIKPGR